MFVIRWTGKKRAAEKSTSCDNEEAELFHKGGFKGFERSCLWDLSRTSFGRGSCLYYPYREERGMPNSLARLSLANELHQNFVLERFCEEGKGSGIQCGLAD